jgi:hypothetical protein
MTQEQYERIIGEPDAGFYKYSQKELFQALDVVPQGSSITANKETRSQQIEKAVGLLQNVDPQMAMNNPVQPYVVNMYEANKMSLEDLDVKNVDDILVKQEPPPPPPPAAPPQGMGPPPMGGMPPQGGGMPPPMGPPPQGGMPQQPPPMGMGFGV